MRPPFFIKALSETRKPLQHCHFEPCGFAFGKTGLWPHPAVLPLAKLGEAHFRTAKAHRHSESTQAKNLSSVCSVAL